MDKVKIGIIGLGGVAQLVHLPNLSKISSADLTAVAEVNKNRLLTISDKFNVKEKYINYKEMLEKSNIDAVIIATPTSTHTDIAIDCLNAGKDVLVEKPLARTYTEAKKIVDAAKKNKKKLMVGMNLRYRPDTMLLRSFINTKEIGEPFYIKCGWIRKQSSSQKWFTKKEQSGGGVIFDLGIHLLDLALWLLDYPEITSVSSQNFYHNTKSVEDTSISCIKCDNSAVINMEVSWSLPVEKDHFFLDVYGTKGSFSSNPFRLYKKVENDYINLTPTQVDNPTILFKKSYLNELKSFIGAIKGLNPVFSPGEEAMQRMKIIEAMYLSADKKQEIKL
ncbi:MAG TPA: Gfo/Idh/MocA family oxidoreductase [Ignavibacteriaceae bacterium]|nr:Gfo/Idh/MocA family oxidoreductase [Ignavibacterium sp.]HRN25634.1 Gfo/Idh/MocA family oxidoreductase [Ignavibacteriaceae bacterium]HRP92451.1 Gfo/Idh/MocA family oxidoreductase [Ignavibacteriaceae bacterium]